MNGYTYQATIDAALDRVSAMMKDREAVLAALGDMTQRNPDLLDDPDLQRAVEILR